MVFDEWWRSIAYSLLDSFDYGSSVHASRISIVPEELKKSKEDAYIPRVVTIGPRFKGSREDLLLMEETKMQCMKHLISRGDRNQDQKMEIFERCGRIIWTFDVQIRANYVVDIKMEQEELAKTMLTDSCFLLELLMSKEFDAQLPSRSGSPNPAFELLRDEDVLSDLTLLENQIPIFFLHQLSKTLFGDLFGNTYEEAATRIYNIFLSILGYSQLEVQNIEPRHVLDIVHFFHNGQRHSKEHHVVDINIDTRAHQPRVAQLKLKRCALKLLRAGVTIKAKIPEDKDSANLVGRAGGLLIRLCNILTVNGKHLDLDPIPEDVKVKGLDFYFKFENGELEIEPLHITKTTKAKWCNLIAWEHHKNYKYFSSSHKGGKFTWAALIFNGLICSADDVQLLKDMNIVVDHLKMNNQELMEYFRTIAFGIDHGVGDFRGYIQMVDDINNYSLPYFIQRIWKKLVNSFRYRQEWIIRFMNRNYNFVATLLAVLTIVQTLYAILAYYFPK